MELSWMDARSSSLKRISAPAPDLGPVQDLVEIAQGQEIDLATGQGLDQGQGQDPIAAPDPDHK